MESFQSKSRLCPLKSKEDRVVRRTRKRPRKIRDDEKEEQNEELEVETSRGQRLKSLEI